MINHYRSRNFFVSSNNILKGMIIANIIIFFISLLLSGKNTGFSINPFSALMPSTKVLNFLGASGTLPIDGFNAWWSLLTANWLHGSLLHIVFNMIALNAICPLVIREFGIFRMFSIYSITGVAGFFFSYIGGVYITIGASAGLCGLIGASLFFGKSRGGFWGQLVYKQTTGWIISLILIGFFLPNINNWGHAGGLFAGIFSGWLFGYNEKRLENSFDKALSILFALATLFFLVRQVIKGFLIVYM